MKNVKTLVVALVLLLVIASVAPARSFPPTKRPKLRVKVTATGIVYLNGNQVSLSDLKKAFVELKSKKGTVWYHRENPQDDPPPQAMEVIEAIIEAKLPVKMCATEAELNKSP